MNRCRLNGWCMGTGKKAHAHLKKRLGLPDYYGNNLDALCDCLTEIGEPTEITLLNAAYMRKKLGDYGTKLLSVLSACTGENPKLKLTVRERW